MVEDLEVGGTPVRIHRPPGEAPKPELPGDLRSRLEETCHPDVERREQLALGLVSATQSRYTPQQMILDISAGSRTSHSPSSAAQTVFRRMADPPLRRPA